MVNLPGPLSRPPSPRLVLLPALALCGWLAGAAVDLGLAGRLALPEDATLARPEWTAPSPADAASPALADLAAPPRRPRRADYVDPVVQRSIFDSSRVGAKGKDETTDGELLTDLDLVLLATVVALPDDYSSALIAKQGQRKTRRRRGELRVLDDGIDDATGFGVGDEVFGKATLVAIEPGKVVLERGGVREVLRIGEVPDDEAPPAKGRALARPADDDDGIEKLGKDHYVIDRETIDRLAANPASLSRLGRATPHKSGGEVDGYRLSRIRKNSPGRKLGLRSGDVVHSVSGYSLTNMGDAMKAFQELQDASEIEVELSRRDQRRTVKVEIR